MLSSKKDRCINHPSQTILHVIILGTTGKSKEKINNFLKGANNVAMRLVGCITTEHFRKRSLEGGELVNIFDYERSSVKSSRPTFLSSQLADNLFRARQRIYF